MVVRKGISLEGVMFYVIYFFCDICFKFLINVGIREIVYEEMYFNEVIEIFLREV